MQNKFEPLATRMRPLSLSEFIGQQHLLAEGKPLNKAVNKGYLHSMILWGNPGTGKTTLAKLMAKSQDAAIEEISAVLAGVKEIREVLARAEQRQGEGRKTILFVDEVHRFNKAQQDAFLPHVESGLITLIGATTENPSFQLNNALLSRARVYVLKPLTETDLLAIVENALINKERGLGEFAISMTEKAKQQIVQYADGDARQALNLLEMASDFSHTINEALLKEVLTNGVRRFDQKGEAFYDQISALHKSVRGSDPNAALYWFCRMVDGGCDTAYIARRVLRMASEDIGNADPRALEITLNAWNAFERLGSPEGELAIAQAIIYLSCAAKSNASYVAYNRAMEDIKKNASLEVPLHLRNAPTKLMKELNYGKAYRYAHDEPHAYAAGENYFPEGMGQPQYYQPVDRGLEIKIKEKIDFLKKLNNPSEQ